MNNRTFTPLNNALRDGVPLASARIEYEGNTLPNRPIAGNYEEGWSCNVKLNLPKGEIGTLYIDLFKLPPKKPPWAPGLWNFYDVLASPDSKYQAGQPSLTMQRQPTTNGYHMPRHIINWTATQSQTFAQLGHGPDTHMRKITFLCEITVRIALANYRDCVQRGATGGFCECGMKEDYLGPGAAGTSGFAHSWPGY